MKGLILPQDYKAKLTLRETQRAIKIVKDNFQRMLAAELNLDRVTAPLIVSKDSGINDDLNGVERKVEFDMKESGGIAEIVQSLAKWKRMALYRYGYAPGEGIYTDMNAVRRDDQVDNVHSLFVDQWDWEKVISPEERNIEFLKDTVRKIVKAAADTQNALCLSFPCLNKTIEREVFFVTSQELEDMYPTLSGKEREDAVTREHKTVFLMQIGQNLRSGQPHDGRAPDYDDWSLNGDILVWNDVLGRSLELSSMGIRVDKNVLRAQLEQRGALDRMKFDYHKMICDETLPLTIGGGVGQSRLCMQMLERAHIGEVQVSVWPEQMRQQCMENGIFLL
ncbi:MAG: aspartate--ammonia ligase [Ruminococcaceae bacterium]|nr:aspartate--ammonia ligase [Oscillospiraceae bacterium]